MRRGRLDDLLQVGTARVERLGDPCTPAGKSAVPPKAADFVHRSENPHGTQAAAGGKQILSTPSLAWAYPGGEAA